VNKNKTVASSIIVVSILALAISAFGGPRLVMYEKVFDFGYVPQQARVAHIFHLKSAGNDVLKIVKVTPGCGCTQAPLDKSEIPAGDSARLEIIFDTGMRNGPTTKSPRIETNEDNRAVHLRFTANIVANFDDSHLIKIDPFILDLSRKKGGEDEGYKFQIANTSEKDLSLALVDYPSDLFEISLPDKIEAGATVEGSLRIKGELAEPSLEKSFTIELNDEAKTRYTIPVKSNKPTLGVKNDLRP